MVVRSPQKRKPIRLRGFDYSQPGPYFVTVCTRGKRCLLGRVIGGEVVLTGVGKIVQEAWFDIGHRFGGLQLDAFVVMPNHIHGILRLSGRGFELRRLPKDGPVGGASPAPTEQPATLSRIVGAFKSISNLWVRRRMPRVRLPLWQRGFYEHIIRGPADLDEIREYIRLNPAKWSEDPDHVPL